MAEVILWIHQFFQIFQKNLIFQIFVSFQIFDCFKIFENFKRSWWLNRTELTKCNNIWSYIRYRVPPSVVALKVSYGSVINFFLKFWKFFEKCKNFGKLIFLKNSKRFHHALFEFFKNFEFFRIFKFFKIFQNFKKSWWRTHSWP